MPRARNPFAYVIWAHHEAGHAIVGHALCGNLEKVYVSKDRDKAQTLFTPMEIPDPVFLREKHERERRIAVLRRMIAVHVAGPLAVVIHQGQVAKRGYVSRQEEKGYETYWDCPMSITYPDEMSNTPGSDYSNTVYKANLICMAQFYSKFELLIDIKTGLAKIKGLKKKVSVKEMETRIRGEIVRAETANRVLKKHWQAVTDLATALNRSKSGEMSRKQVLELVGDQFETS